MSSKLDTTLSALTDLIHQHRTMIERLEEREAKLAEMLGAAERLLATAPPTDEPAWPPGDVTDAADDPVAGAVAEPTGHGSPSEETPAEAAADMLGTLYINLHKEPRQHTRQVIGDAILEVIDVLTEWAPVPPPPHVPGAPA